MIIQAAWTYDSLNNEQTLTHALLQNDKTHTFPARLTFTSTETHQTPNQGHSLSTSSSICTKWQTSTEEDDKHATTTAEQVEHYYNQHARIGVGSNMAIQNSVPKIWERSLPLAHIADTSSRLLVGISWSGTISISDITWDTAQLHTTHG